jgi:hypothetical protein
MDVVERPVSGHHLGMETELRVQAAVWLLDDGPLAFLFCDDPRRTAETTASGDSVDLLFSMVHEFGLPWLRPDDELSFASAAGWCCRVEGQNQLTVDWPGRTGYPFLFDLDLPWPDGWWDAAQARNCVVLLCGRFEAFGERDPYEVLMAAATAGGLAGGTIPFESRRRA